MFSHPAIPYYNVCEFPNQQDVKSFSLYFGKNKIKSGDKKSIISIIRLKKNLIPWQERLKYVYKVKIAAIEIWL